uniref:Uncharacterized protein LOC116949082 n=1 Tax=Petromyzon marinus TaxID=7757 RepID=A0AAJ7TQA6_PETMA|nr:uncharacterized protein LOC116949082 [Petromyzon marinus]
MDNGGGQQWEDLKSLLPSPPATPDALSSPGHGGATQHTINIYPNPTSRLLESGEAELHLRQVEHQQQQKQRQHQESAATIATPQWMDLADSSSIEPMAMASRAGSAAGAAAAGSSGGGGCSVLPCNAAERTAGPSLLLHKRLQEEAQSLARDRAGTPDFQACRGGGPHGHSVLCATHSHGRCFRLHWCCLLGWCHCKYVYRAFTPLERLPSTAVPVRPGDATQGRLLPLVRWSTAAAPAAALAAVPPAAPPDAVAAGEVPEPSSTPTRCLGARGDLGYPWSAARRPKPGELIHSVESVV